MTGKKTNHARTNRAIWGDDDWLDLSPMAKLVYFTLTTSPDLTLCGGHEWNATRLRERIGGTVADIEAAGKELERELFVLIDHDTSEALVRSWMKHDGLCRSPNMTIAAARARLRLSSRRLKGVVVHEMSKIRLAHPEWDTTWTEAEVADLLRQRAVNPSETVPERVPETLPESFPKPNGNPSPNPSRIVPETKSDYLLPTTNYQKTSSTPAASTERYTPDFESWWKAYPRKVGKGAAAKAFVKALKQVSSAELETITARYARSVAGTEERFIPHPATWLNECRWEDQPAVGLPRDPKSGLLVER